MFRGSTFSFLTDLHEWVKVHKLNREIEMSRHKMYRSLPDRVTLPGYLPPLFLRILSHNPKFPWLTDVLTRPVLHVQARDSSQINDNSSIDTTRFHLFEDLPRVSKSTRRRTKATYIRDTFHRSQLIMCLN